MTSRPRFPAVRPPAAPLAWPVAVAAFAAATWAALLSWLAVVSVFTLGWLTAPNNTADFTSAIAAGTAAWSLGHAIPITVDGLQFSLVPLLLTFGFVWLLRRTAGWTIRNSVVLSRAGVLGLLVTFSLGYGLLVGLLTASLGPQTANLSRGVLAGAAWAGFAGVLAVVRSPGVTGPVSPPTFSRVGERTEAVLRAQSPHSLMLGLWQQLPKSLRDGLATGLRFWLWLSILAVLPAGYFLVRATGDMSAITQYLAVDLPSQFAIWLITLAYLPVYLAWTVALLLGPGYQVGAGSVITIASQTLGPLPSLPILAAVPLGLPEMAVALFALPLFAGAMAWKGWALDRGNAVRDLAVRVVGSAGSAAVIGFAVAALSNGSLGTGRLNVVGAEQLYIAAAAAIWCGAMGLIIGGLQLAWRKFRSPAGAEVD